MTTTTTTAARTIRAIIAMVVHTDIRGDIQKSQKVIFLFDKTMCDLPLIDSNDSQQQV